MSPVTDVRLYFDFVSPYAWLALMSAEDFAREHGVRWELRPVVFAKLLDATGLVGPVEVEAKRQYTFRDAVRCATRLGLRISGPPTHPFRSLEALRAVTLVRESPGAVRFTAALADAAWGEGRDLADVHVVADVARSAGFEDELATGDLLERLALPETKARLARATQAAVENGVFGIPTFECEGELFWGHDRMVHLAERIAGRLASPEDRGRVLAARPWGLARRRRGGPSRR